MNVQIALGTFQAAHTPNFSSAIPSPARDGNSKAAVFPVPGWADPIQS